jgi:dihydrofolate reductase
MKQQLGKDPMLQCGTGLVSTFIQSGLIDEYRIGVVPIILGAGNSLSEALKDKLNLKLLKTKTFNSGLVFTSLAAGINASKIMLLEALIRMREVN